MRLAAENQDRTAQAQLPARSRESGFTLLETSIAMMIMLVAALAASALFVYAINYNSGARDRAMALALAQQRMERLRNAPFDDAVLDAGTSTENITSEGRPFAVSTTICADAGCGGSATLKRITVTVTPGSAGASWVRTTIVIQGQRAATITGDYFL